MLAVEKRMSLWLYNSHTSKPGSDPVPDVASIVWNMRTGQEALPGFINKNTHVVSSRRVLLPGKMKTAKCSIMHLDCRKLMLSVGTGEWRELQYAVLAMGDLDQSLEYLTPEEVYEIFRRQTSATSADSQPASAQAEPAGSADVADAEEDGSQGSDGAADNAEPNEMDNMLVALHGDQHVVESRPRASSASIRLENPKIFRSAPPDYLEVRGNYI